MGIEETAEEEKKICKIELNTVNWKRRERERQIEKTLLRDFSITTVL